jgi:hypothetical protein
MALVVRLVSEERAGHHKEVTVSVDFDSSYPTGGEAFDPAMSPVGIPNPDIMLAESKAGYNFVLNRSGKKLLAYNGTTQASNGADLSAVTDVRLKICGRV